MPAVEGVLSSSIGVLLILGVSVDMNGLMGAALVVWCGNEACLATGEIGASPEAATGVVFIG